MENKNVTFESDGMIVDAIYTKQGGFQDVRLTSMNTGLTDFPGYMPEEHIAQAETEALVG